MKKSVVVVAARAAAAALAVTVVEGRYALSRVFHRGCAHPVSYITYACVARQDMHFTSVRWYIGRSGARRVIMAP